MSSMLTSLITISNHPCARITSQELRAFLARLQENLQALIVEDQSKVDANDMAIGHVKESGARDIARTDCAPFKTDAKVVTEHTSCTPGPQEDMDGCGSPIWSNEEEPFMILI